MTRLANSTYLPISATDLQVSDVAYCQLHEHSYGSSMKAFVKEKLQRRRVLTTICLAVSLVGVTAWVVLSQRERQPEDVRDEYLRCLSAKNWVCLYRLSPEAERAWTGISERQFVQFCERLATEVPPHFLLNVQYGPPRSVNPRSDKGFRLDYSNYLKEVPPSERPGTASGYGMLFLRRDPTGWRALVSPLPFHLLGLNLKSRRDRVSFFANQLEAVGLSEWRTFENRMVYPTSSLKAFAAGKMDWNQVGKPSQ